MKPNQRPPGIEEKRYEPVERKPVRVLESDPTLAAYLDQVREEREALKRGEMPPVVVKPPPA